VEWRATKTRRHGRRDAGQTQPLPFGSVFTNPVTATSDINSRILQGTLQQLSLSNVNQKQPESFQFSTC